MRVVKMIFLFCLLAVLLAGAGQAYADVVATGTEPVNAAEYASNAPGIRWEETYSGTMGSGIHGVSRTSDGGFIVVGFNDSFSEYRDIYLLKLGPDGHKQWDNHYSGEHNATGMTVSETPDGYIIGGYIIPEDSGRHEYMYLIKTDRLGNKVWDKTYADPAYEEQHHYQWQYANAIFPTGDGYVVAGGWAAWAGFSLETPVLMKVDQDVHRVWDMKLESGWYESPNAVINTSDGGYLILSNGTHVTKTDASGNIQWGKEYQSTGKLVHLTDVVEASGGGYLLGGYTSFDGRDNTTYDAIFVKIDSGGSQEWNRAFRRDNLIGITAICRTSDGGYAAVGTLYEPYLAGKYNSSSYNLYVLKLDSVGHIQWEKDIIGNIGDYREDKHGKAIGQTPDGSLIIFGDRIFALKNSYNQFYVVSLGTGDSAPATGKTSNPSCVPLLLLPLIGIISLAAARKKIGDR